MNEGSGVAVRQAAPRPGRPRKQPRTCTIDGCGRRTKSRGLCRAHLHRLYRYGDPLIRHKGSDSPTWCKVCGSPVARSRQGYARTCGRGDKCVRRTRLWRIYQQLTDQAKAQLRPG